MLQAPSMPSGLHGAHSTAQSHRGCSTCPAPPAGHCAEDTPRRGFVLTSFLPPLAPPPISLVAIFSAFDNEQWLIDSSLRLEWFVICTCLIFAGNNCTAGGKVGEAADQTLGCSTHRYSCNAAARAPHVPGTLTVAPREHPWSVKALRPQEDTQY